MGKVTRNSFETKVLKGHFLEELLWNYFRVTYGTKKLVNICPPNSYILENVRHNCIDFWYHIIWLSQVILLKNWLHRFYLTLWKFYLLSKSHRVETVARRGLRTERYVICKAPEGESLLPFRRLALQIE